MQADLLWASGSASGDVSAEVARFVEEYRAALLGREYARVWEWLTADSRRLYDGDAGEFARVAARVFGAPELRGRLERARLQGGKLIGSHVVCEFSAAGDAPLPALVLRREGDGFRVDYAFDLTSAGLGYLGARMER